MTKQSLPQISGGIPVLITRPAPQARRFAADLRRSFGARVQPLEAPLMQPVFLLPALPEGAFSALILTSETGAEAARQLRRAGARLPDQAFCVGDRTAAAARDAGFAAASAAGDAGALAELILKAPDPGPMLYLHGRDRAADLAQILHGQRRITSAIGYAQEALPLSPAARRLLLGTHPVILPLFSPRAARLFMAALPEPPSAPLWPVVISANARAALPDPLAARAVLAAHPDSSAMIQAIGRLLPPATA